MLVDTFGHIAVALDQLLRLVEEELRVTVHILEELFQVTLEADFLHDAMHFTVYAGDLIQADLVNLIG